MEKELTNSKVFKKVRSPSISSTGFRMRPRICWTRMALSIRFIFLCSRTSTTFWSNFFFFFKGSPLANKTNHICRWVWHLKQCDKDLLTTTTIIIIKLQFTRCRNMASVTTMAPCNVRCLYSGKLVSEVGTWEKMRLLHVFESLIMLVRNNCADGDCSRKHTTTTNSS